MGCLEYQQPLLHSSPPDNVKLFFSGGSLIGRHVVGWQILSVELVDVESWKMNGVEALRNTEQLFIRQIDTKTE